MSDSGGPGKSEDPSVHPGTVGAPASAGDGGRPPPQDDSPRDESFGARAFLLLLRRSLPLLWPVRYHLLTFVAITGGLGAVVLFVSAAIGLDALWQGVMQGESIRPGTARILGLDPALLSQPDTTLAPELRRELRDHLLGALALLITVLLPAAGALYYYQLWILQRINQHLRTALLARLQALSMRFHTQARVGDSIYRVYQDSAMVTHVIGTLLLWPAVTLVFALITSLQIALAIDVTLVAMLGLALPAAVGLAWWLSPPLRVGFRRARESNSALTSQIQETVSGLKLIKAYGLESTFQQRFEAGSRRAFDRAFGARNRLALYTVLQFWIWGSILVFATFLAVQYTMGSTPLTPLGVWLGATAAQVWNLGVYYTFQQAGGRTSRGIERLFGLWGRAQDVVIGLDRVFEVLDRIPEVADATDAQPLPGVRERIRFEHVSFGYRAEQTVLRDVSLELRPGTITALVGPTGAGKSTLVSLLLRLYDPDEGRITIDGIDLRQLQLDSLRSQVSIALQENVLFGTSVRANIAYANPRAGEEQIQSAASVACAHEFIASLPAGYDTLLGERGTKLSTGQRQRISIARALLKDAPVLILDEPTASLDVETERALMQNLSAWGKERSILLITHRLATLAHVDRIVVLQDGRIVEQGTHATLLQQPDGAYRRWCEREAQAVPQEAAG